MIRNRRFRLRLVHGAVLALVAGIAVVGSFTPGQPVAAQPPAPALPKELRYVPHDAAVFVHMDVAKLLNHTTIKSFRQEDKSLFGNLAEETPKVLGITLDELKSVTVFFPKLKEIQGVLGAGFIFTSTKAFDKQKLEESAAQIHKNNVLLKLKVLTPTENIAVMLLNLGDDYERTRRADDKGPITDAIKAAGSGKHTLVAAATIANLPDELQQEDVFPILRPFQPILQSQSVTATLDLGTSLDVNVRVQCKRDGQAADAEKSLALLVKMLTDEGDKLLKDLPNDGSKDALAVLKAGLAALKAAKYSVDGTEARVAATLPLKDLPVTGAYLHGVQKVQEAADREQSVNNLKQMMLAMHSYAGSYGDCFPPAAICDKKGKPLLSWRVALLPYIDYDDLYKQFKLDEPWDSEHNKKLIAKMPKTYFLRGKQKAGDTNTHYRVFVGNGAAFDWLVSFNLNKNEDGASNTIAVITAATAVPWTKPDELAFEPDKDMTKLVGLVVHGRVQFGMCDGSVRAYSTVLKNETLKAAITHSGGEILPPDF